METVRERVKGVETKLDSYHAEVVRILNDEIKPLKATVEKHGRQITFWQGAVYVLGAVVTAVLGFFGYKGHS